MGPTFDAQIIASMLKLRMFFLVLTVLASCRPHSIPENPETWKKVDIDFHSLDADGLTGPPGAKVAVNYEFCIPSGEAAWKEISKIDSTARRQSGGKGRVGCAKDETLVIGSTHQKRYQRVLYDLASLPFVRKIKTVYWE